MAGFRKDLTTSANAAIMTSGSITAALIAAGVVTEKTAAKAAVAVAEALIEVARPIVDADNALFASVEESAPASKSTGGSKAPAKSTGKANEKLKFGVFKGQTLEQVVDIDADQAEAEFGYKQGSGLDYVVWLAENANEDKVKAAAATLVAA